MGFLTLERDRGYGTAQSAERTRKRASGSFKDTRSALRTSEQRMLGDDPGD
jgi:hypothetical protein